MGEVLKKFGRYFLLDHLAQGGMAEIYRARLAAVDGAGRLIVIKRIQAGYGANSEFLQMFKSEIKVTMGFNHPNIVQLYDFGEEQNQPYIAMELVDGKNLRQFQSRFTELKQPFPIELAAYIIEQAASGLHYAHSFRDKISGQPLNIVHRDISPQNVLISYEGNVKVIDFGIAKATTNMESTRAGVIKGKPSYLSPEQISGETLDGRSDIFALGTVLWEMLSGRKLFAGENDLAVLKLIESCQTHVKPPSTLNPKVPKELDYIVLKALAKQREKRFQTAEEMQRALHKFLYAYMPEFNPADLAYYAKDLFKAEIVEDRKKIQRLNERVESLLAADIPDAPAVPDGQGLKKEDTTTVVENRRGATGAREFSADPGSPKIEMESSPVARPALPSRSSPHASQIPGTTAAGVAQVGSISSASRAGVPQRPNAPRQNLKAGRGGDKSGSTAQRLAMAAAAVVALAFFGPDFGLTIPYLSEMVGASSPEAKLFLDGPARGANVQINGQTVAQALPASVKGIPVGTPVRVTVTGADGASFSQDVTLRKGEQRHLAVQLENRGLASPEGGGLAQGQAPGAAPGARTILLRLNVTPCGGPASIAINGRAVTGDTPSMDVPLDSPLELTGERMGFKPFKREFVLDSRQVGGLKEWLMDVPLEPLRYGFLTIRSSPSADAHIEGGSIRSPASGESKACVKKTPLESEKFPVGTYEIRLVNDVLGMEKKVTVTIQEGRQVNIDERLQIK